MEVQAGAQNLCAICAQLAVLASMLVFQLPHSPGKRRHEAYCKRATCASPPPPTPTSPVPALQRRLQHATPRSTACASAACAGVSSGIEGWQL